MGIEWENKVLEMCISYKEFTEKFLTSQGKNMIIVASCPFVLAEEARKKIKMQDQAALLEYDR